MVIELSQNFSLVNSWINELRNVETQTNRNSFRRSMERIMKLFAYHISQDLEYKEIEIATPLDKIVVKEIAVQACSYHYSESWRSSFPRSS